MRGILIERNIVESIVTRPGITKLQVEAELIETDVLPGAGLVDQKQTPAVVATGESYILLKGSIADQLTTLLLS
jgi:hypothetical protein